MVVALGELQFVFPGGKPTIQKDVNIAGNVATTKTVPTGKIWLLLNVKVFLTTDGTVATRIVSLTCQDIANSSKFYNYGGNHVASTLETYFFTQSVGATGALVNALGVQLLSAGEDVVITIINGVAGDDYDYLIEYLETDAP